MHPRMFDHSPVMVSLLEICRNNGRLFRFLNHLANYPLFFCKVAASWDMRVRKYPMFKLVRKIKVVKTIVKLLNSFKGHVIELWILRLDWLMCSSAFMITLETLLFTRES